jgi:hypothetical protein
MNDQQRAAMQMALTTLEELKTNCTIWLESDDAAITALREALAQPQNKGESNDVSAMADVEQSRMGSGAKDGEVMQPQGEWVDLTDYEIGVAFTGSPCLIPHQNQINGLRAVIAKFKEKNTPPVVPQGEPVAESASYCVGNIHWIVPPLKDGTPLYAAPVDAKAIRAEALEEAAKACDAIEEDHWNLYKGRKPYTGSEAGRADPHEQGVSMGAEECAAAIRGLK